MSKIGRNDPCPCGSGKKYKKCCQVSVDADDFEYRRQRRVEAALMPRLLDFAIERYGPESFQEAWDTFNDIDEDDEGVPVAEPGSPIDHLFMSWFLFNCEFEDTSNSDPSDRTIAESFWLEHESELTEEEIAFLDAAVEAPFSLYEVLNVRRGVGMQLCDLFTREQAYVTEHTATLNVEQGMIIYGALMDIRGVRSPLALGPVPLLPTSKRIVVELREEMLKALGQLTSLDVLDCDKEIRALYFGLLVDQLTPPALVNTDREPLLPQKVYFDLKSVNDAFERLHDLAGEGKRDRLLEEATMDEDRIVSVEVPWMSGPERNVVLGMLRLGEGRLVAEVNSEERAERVREIIEDRLAELVTYKTTLIEPMNLDFSEEQDFGKGFSDEDSPFLGPNDPAVKAILADFTKKHWEEWLDIPVPALNDVTPREASLTEAGRDLLESLLAEFEIRNKLEPNNVTRPDVAALRRELRMD